MLGIIAYQRVVESKIFAKVFIECLIFFPLVYHQFSELVDIFGCLAQISTRVKRCWNSKISGQLEAPTWTWHWLILKIKVPFMLTFNTNIIQYSSQVCIDWFIYHSWVANFKVSNYCWSLPVIRAKIKLPSQFDLVFLFHLVPINFHWW